MKSNGWKSFLQSLPAWLRRRGPEQANAYLRKPQATQLDTERIKGMVRGIMSTRPDEIGCEECFRQMDRFVDMTLAGKNPAEAMPLVQDHLERCDDCREEFEALLAALRQIS